VHNSVTEELNRQKQLGPFAYWYLLKSKKNLAQKQLISVSEGIAEEINSGNVITPSDIRTIYNPFDIETIKEKASIVNEAIPKEPYIIHVGRLAKQKRHDVLFAAFVMVNTSVNLVLLCNKPDKALKLAKKYGIEDRIILPGFQSNPYNWIKQAQALVLSSDYEGLPTVLLEAIAVNTKVVSTNCPHGPNEILTGDLAKYLVPRRKPEQLAQVINQVLKDEVKLDKAEILAKVSATNIAAQYLSLT
jgi:glycosyltransferase involved in cell wall biosynthesis